MQWFMWGFGYRCQDSHVCGESAASTLFSVCFAGSACLHLLVAQAAGFGLLSRENEPEKSVNINIILIIHQSANKL